MPKPKHKTMLKKEADKQGLKLGWIAHKADIEPTKFSRIANGTQLPNVSEALLIADILEVDVRDLWEPKKVKGDDANVGSNQEHRGSNELQD